MFTTSFAAPDRFLSTLPARSDRCSFRPRLRSTRFLSTLPARGATFVSPNLYSVVLYFYPRSPRGERRSKSSSFWAGILFLSTLPARGATRCGDPAPPAQTISIHAPREGSDPTTSTMRAATANFYPRSPRGERPMPKMASPRPTAFLSTLPARGATPRPRRRLRRSSDFYPRSPRGERPTVKTTKPLYC